MILDARESVWSTDTGASASIRAYQKIVEEKSKVKYFGQITIGVPGSLLSADSLIQGDTKNFLTSPSSKSHASTMSSTPLVFSQYLKLSNVIPGHL